MRHVPLGRDDTISEIMLGTMTYGTQTDRPDAYRQMDMAADAGVTWLDTAEVYPVNPMRAETVGVTETIVGEWLAEGNAGRMRIATKHGGEGGPSRDGAPITADTIRPTIEESLRRLGVDAIDLYQFHWPNRGSFQFRQYWSYRPEGRRDAIVQDIADCAGALAEEVSRGTIRAFGLSNESTWGMDRWIGACADPVRPVSLQNEYSLLCRIGDTDLTEMMVYEDVTMLAFSPLAAGILTGKYQGGAVPDGSRRAINEELGGRWTRGGERVEAAVDAYHAVARDAGLDPVHMALAWLQTRPFACSAILGATTAEQLEHGLKAQDLVLPDDVVKAIDATHRAHPMPY
ncbi:aldo/keto reductase [Jannaschia sp. LMIT008]|uniref:aldo/keto reductase n=1 Tax=Jannaschia maritima TaxID=3032585 RepID=UPI0028120473|nr:aldo/keto reductase [Jannaschia sp. LMIT008]